MARADDAAASSPVRDIVRRPKYATLVWAVIIPLRLVVGRLTSWTS
jgi:hypothetical protein